MATHKVSYLSFLCFKLCGSHPHQTQHFLFITIFYNLPLCYPEMKFIEHTYHIYSTLPRCIIS